MSTFAGLQSLHKSMFYETTQIHIYGSRVLILWDYNSPYCVGLHKSIFSQVIILWDYRSPYFVGLQKSIFVRLHILNFVGLHKS